MQIQSNNGFSLIEVMVASGLMVSMALGFATVLSNVSRSQNHIQSNIDFSALSNIINAYTMNAEVCSDVLKGNPVDGQSPNQCGTGPKLEKGIFVLRMEKMK